MKDRPILLHVHPGASSFVVKDRRLLSAAFDVRDAPFIWRHKWQVPLLMVAQAFRLLFCRWNAAVVQFGGYHALIPAIAARMTGRTCIIIAGGTDCVSFPSLGYGNFARQPLAWATRRAYALAHAILPVHSSLIKSINFFQLNDPPEQGILAHMPELRTRIMTVPNGYSGSDWSLGKGPRDIDVISVASGAQRPSTLFLKGIDLLIEAARSRPHLRFMVIGLHAATSIRVPPNLTIHGPVPNTTLLGYYQRAKVYAQLSISEGFPNALCEAMLCGCVPVVSAVGAMPDIVGDCGRIVERRDLSLVLQALDDLVPQANMHKAHKARSRITDSYSEERRAQELIAAIMGNLH